MQLYINKNFKKSTLSSNNLKTTNPKPYFPYFQNILKDFREGRLGKFILDDMST